METTSGAAFARVVRDIQAGDPAGKDLLHAHFSSGLRLLLTRNGCGDRAGELAQEALRATTSAVESGELADPMDLPRLVRTMARRVASHELAGAGLSGTPNYPFDGRAAEVAATVLESFSAKGREALVRFYHRRQAPSRICAEMNLSPEQFQHLKSEARQAFASRKPR